MTMRHLIWLFCLFYISQAYVKIELNKEYELEQHRDNSKQQCRIAYTYKPTSDTNCTIVAEEGAYDGPGQTCTNITPRSFVIDPTTKQFLKDGEPFRYVSGSIHYMRVPPEYWRDRLRKLRFSGCNAVQTYVEWSSHEPEPGVYNFDHGQDLIKFIEIAAEEDLLVILRPGPYICAERDMGGLPYWLLRINPFIQLRRSDPDYEFYVQKWFNVLMPKLKPYMYANGGPVIMVQIENEYGSYSACDIQHTSNLRDMVRNHLGPDVLLFTTDGWMTRNLRCGKIPEVYATVDFGAEQDVDKAFKNQRLFEPNGPLVNSEYYPGWLDHWGEPHSKVDAEAVAVGLDEMLSRNASVNIYVFHGGSNFGLSSGANYGGQYQPCPTSYDYDAPVTESGELTYKYYAIREVIGKYLDLPSGPLPEPNLPKGYGEVHMKFRGGVLELGGVIEGVENEWPLPFEELYLSNGIVIYNSKIPFRIENPSKLQVNDIHERGYVFVESELAGILARQNELYEMPLFGFREQELSIVVESQGRIGYGDKINEQKKTPSKLQINDIHDRGYVFVESEFAGILARQNDLYEMPLFGFREQKLSIVVESQGRIIEGDRNNEQKEIPSKLQVNDIHDRGYVFVESEFSGILDRQNELFEMPLFGFKEQELSIVVESQGRIGVGDKNNEQKGIITNVTIGFKPLPGWTMKKIPMDGKELTEALQRLDQQTIGQPTKTKAMAFYDGEFNIPGTPSDTYLRFDGWSKGYVWINDFLLGRYWPTAGPQINLYVPRFLLNSGLNSFRVLELERTPCLNESACYITLVDYPDIDGPTPES